MTDFNWNGFDDAIRQDDYEWLQRENPRLFDNIGRLVAANVSPTDIQTRALQLMTGDRSAMARRIYNTAVYMHSRIAEQKQRGYQQSVIERVKA